jgi:TrmH family RNA methyltransferase
MMLTSSQNPRIKWLHALQIQPRQRREERAFVVEGVRLAEEALAGGWNARLVIYTEDLNSRGKAVVADFAARGAAVELVSEAVLRFASDTETPQGLLIALDWRVAPLPASLDFVFIPDKLRDPGNLGTMLRTAAAAGVQAVFLPPETTDAFAPKVLRAGMGAHFRLPLQALSWDEIAKSLPGLNIYLASAGKGLSYTQADFKSPLALIVGGEAEGASSQANRLSTDCVHIPMPGGSESLNAAIAAGVLLFEVLRQRSLWKEIS